jgi:ATP-dependent RNA helicase RhlE
LRDATQHRAFALVQRSAAHPGFKVLMSFRELNLHPNLLRAVEELGFTKPTPIQQQSIGPALEGRDVLACAQTGSGKTAAFALPILQRLQGGSNGRVRALVLTPTRELAAQVHEHFVALARYTGLRAAAVFGGVGMGPQEKAFRDGVDIMVATPGRLLDHLQNSYARLDGLEVLVLDEADRMLDMGFLPDVRRILRQIPAKRQTLFFSATMPAPIVTLSAEMLKNAAGVNVERKQAPAKTVAQSLYPVREELKADLFLELVRRGEVGSVIVFTRTKHRANRLAEFLDKHGVPNARIHGNRSQTARTDALSGFKAGRYRVLVATDIVARGIDVEALEHVVNFDVPHVPEDYIHRVGRTGRAEATGDALTFVSPEEEADLRSIERAVGKPLPRRKLEGFDYNRKPVERFEVPLAERIKEIRARKAEERARAKEKAERKAQREAEDAARGPSRGSRPAREDRPRASGAPVGAGSGNGGSRRRRRPAGNRS